MSELVCVLSKDASDSGLVKTSNKQKTQKKKVTRSNNDKSKLWDIYDNDKSESDIYKKKRTLSNVYMLKILKYVIYVRLLL